MTSVYVCIHIIILILVYGKALRQDRFVLKKWTTSNPPGGGRTTKTVRSKIDCAALCLRQTGCHSFILTVRDSLRVEFKNCIILTGNDTFVNNSHSWNSSYMVYPQHRIYRRLPPGKCPHHNIF